MSFHSSQAVLKIATNEGMVPRRHTREGGVSTTATALIYREETVVDSGPFRGTVVREHRSTFSQISYSNVEAVS